MIQPEISYPIQFAVDYPEVPRNRLTAFFRFFLAIPIWIVLTQLSGASFNFAVDAGAVAGTTAGGILFIGPLLMILFRQKYPRWWFDWNLALMKFENRVSAYFFLLRDEYPSTDEEQAVHLEIPYPDVESDLNRWLPLVKWLLAIPHYFVLFFLEIAAIVAVIISWFLISFTGSHPVGLFDFLVGVMRWFNRVAAYAFLLVTDSYPPFRLSP